MSAKTYDVIIVGGGVMGCSTAYHLVRADPSLRVAVVERDPTYEYASSTLSMANARIQFRLRENVEISRHTLDVLETFDQDMAVGGERPAIGFHREGNLFLAEAEGEGAAREALALQETLGCQVEWWPREEIEERYPLYRAAGFAGGTFGPRDGHLDAWAFLMGYRSKAKELGATFIRDEAVEVLRSSGRTEGVRLAAGEAVAAGNVVNCAGAWGADLARTAGVKLPVEPVKRQIFVVDPATKPDGPLPLTILPAGLYFRTETSGLVLAGWSTEDDPVGFDFHYDRDRFLEVLWPELARVVPAFDTLKLVRAWAGLHAVNRLDGQAILGEWPELAGFHLANGFSGHGLQQAPAVGRYLAELILDQQHVLDLSLFGPARVLDRRPLPEDGLARAKAS